MEEGRQLPPLLELRFSELEKAGLDEVHDKASKNQCSELTGAVKVTEPNSFILQMGNLRPKGVL